MALVDAALRVFSSRSYRGATTAEIAREAGVTEPILYRHFESKRELYLACLDEAWARVRLTWEAALAREASPGEWMGHAFAEKMLMANLWAQALTEASDDSETRRCLRRHLREVHDVVATVVRRAQERGHIPPDRDPEAEAWIFIGLGLLAGQKVVGLTAEELERIRASRRRWLTECA